METENLVGVDLIVITGHISHETTDLVAHAGQPDGHSSTLGADLA